MILPSHATNFSQLYLVTAAPSFMLSSPFLSPSPIAPAHSFHNCDYGLWRCLNLLLLAVSQVIHAGKPHIYQLPPLHLPHFRISVVVSISFPGGQLSCTDPFMNTSDSSTSQPFCRPQGSHYKTHTSTLRFVSPVIISRCTASNWTNARPRQS